MSIHSGEVRFPPRKYKTFEELSLPENEKIRNADVDAFLTIDEKVHASVEGSKIIEFYNGKSVFVTGGTGFIGKLVVEKLLRSCTGIKTIYFLIREKKGKDAKSRLDNTFDNVIFSELRKAQPKFRNKVEPIVGDVSLPNLGISVADRKKLIENVDVIIHGAACVLLFEPLRKAATVQVSGTKEVMILAHQCENLVSLVHISTAYSQCVYPKLEEKHYDPVYETEPFLKMIEECTDEELSINQEKILNGWPNSYTFTKAIAEHTVRSMANYIPTAILRPSLVLSTFKQPIHGWNDNLNGPIGVLVVSGIGILRTFLVDEQKIGDMVPGDYVANAVIAAAYQNQFNRKGVVEIYNSVSSAENPIPWKDFQNLCSYYGMQNPSIFMVYYNAYTVNKNRYVHLLYEIFLQWLPALFIDSILYFTKTKKRLMKVYTKTHRFNNLNHWFLMSEWQMHNDNLQKMWNGLSAKDREIFEFSMAPENFNWNRYLILLVIGVRQFIVKDRIETIPAARRKYKRLYYIHTGFKIVCLLIALKLLMIIFNAFISYS